MDAPDHIVVNAGGLRYETTVATLRTAPFFRALFGPTGAALAVGTRRSKKRKQQNDDLLVVVNNENNNTIFVDCDPDLFQDVLYFMRRGRLPSQTALSAQRLEDLKAEADFFAFESLEKACKAALKNLQKKVQKALKDQQPKPSTAHSRCLRLDGIDNGDKYHMIDIPKGHILYIVSATMELNEFYLKCDANSDRWRQYKIVVLDQDKIDEEGRDMQDERECCIASMCFGDQFSKNKHNVPILMETHKDIRLCFSRPERGYIQIAAAGHAVWNLVYWVGKPEDIPGLQPQHHTRNHGSGTLSSAPVVVEDGSSTMIAAVAAAALQSQATLAAAAIAASRR